MSVEPPSSGRPTGPPSGPLSGSSRPPAGPPPSQPPSGGYGGKEPHGPWWKSVPRVAALTAALVAAVVLGVFFTHPGGGGSTARGEVFLEAANSTGQDPFTESTATEGTTPTAPGKTTTTPGKTTTSPGKGTTPPGRGTTSPGQTTPAAPPPTGPSEVRGVQGGAPGLYSGVRKTASCDVERQIRALQADPSKNRAFASSIGVQPAGVSAYLRSLTSVQLRADTRVTNHGYRDGNATSYQAVLQSGTAVLIDGHGVPRLRCACGNPLKEPVAQHTAPRLVGQRWSSYQPANVVLVQPAPVIVNVFVIYDSHHHEWLHRHRGDDTGRHDQRGKPPKDTRPWVPAPCVTGKGSGSPCPPTSPNASPSPSLSSPSSSTSPSSSSSSPSSPSSKSSSPSSPSSESSSPSSKSSSPSSESSTSSPSSKSPESSPPSESKSSSPSSESSSSSESKPASPSSPETSAPSSEKSPATETPSAQPSSAETSAPSAGSPSLEKPAVTPPSSAPSAPAPAETAAPQTGGQSQAPQQQEQQQEQPSQ